MWKFVENMKLCEIIIIKYANNVNNVNNGKVCERMFKICERYECTWKI